MRFALVLCLVLSSGANAADLPDTKEFVNQLGMKFVRLDAGQFVMGTGEQPPQTREEWLDRDGDESPAHPVRISRPFFIGTFEVTNEQFRQFAPQHASLNGKLGQGKSPDEPITHVTWRDAVEFCRWISDRERLPYRLPTEAEWEYACRAGSAKRFSTGDSLSPEQANFGLDRDGKTKIGVRRVGSFPANAWGLHDLHGNVAEWCLDWFGPYAAGEQTDPVGRADGYARVVRGWSWLSTGFQSTPRFCRSANRSGHLPEDANRYTGFRVVLGELPSTQPLPLAEPPLNQRDVKQTPAPTTGPDPSQPYFVNFGANQANPTIPPNTWGPIFSQHNHFSAVAVCPNGDVLAVWYTCVGEADRQLAQAASRLRAGSDRWEPASFFFGVPDVNGHAPVLLRDGNRLFHFCTQSFFGWDYASNIVRFSDDNGATWSKPRIMLTRDDPNRLSQPCSALVAPDGALLLACDGDVHKDEKLMVSTDRGETWKVARGDMRKSAGGRYVIHPAIELRKDGSLLSFLRGPEPMPLLISKDRGDSWEVTESPFGGISSGQKCAVLKLASGSWLMLTFDKYKWFGGGSLVALSLDEGRTWPHVRKVDAPVGGYMSLAQAPNGVVYLIGSRMNFAACNEAWLKEGKPLPK